MSRDIFVPRPKFDQMADKCSCNTIGNSGCSNGSVNFNNEMYIITGSMSDINGYISFWAIKAVPLSAYNGSLKPLKRDDHLIDRLEGNREVGYDGMLIMNEGKEVVLTGETIFFKTDETKIQS